MSQQKKRVDRFAHTPFLKEFEIPFSHRLRNEMHIRMKRLYMLIQRSLDFGVPGKREAQTVVIPLLSR
jgi:hypothetical protein